MNGLFIREKAVHYDSSRQKKLYFTLLKGHYHGVEPVSQIDRYEIRELLGEGAMSKIFSAWDPKLHREVALKKIDSNVILSEKNLDRFQREVRAIAALKHPNIVEIYDYSDINAEHYYLVMERLDGDDLFNIMHENGAMPEPIVAAIGHELCLALKVAHQKGVIHRDIKPENVMLTQSGRVVLTDFGVVKAVREDSAVTGWRESTDVIGTVGFMAPELILKQDLQPGTDIFALGALLYNVATLQMPYPGENAIAVFEAVQAGNYRPVQETQPNLSQGFCELLKQSLDGDPKNRLANIDEVLAQLKDLLKNNGVNDLRDDLRDYINNPQGYEKMHRQRLIDHLLRGIKLAIKDKNVSLAEQLQGQLLDIDPFNQALTQITGLHLREEFNELDDTRPSRNVAQENNTDGGIGIVPLSMAIVLGILLAFGAYILLL